MKRSSIPLLLAWPLLVALIGCGSEEPRAFGTLTDVRTQAGSSEVAGITLYGLRNPTNWDFAVAFESDARRSAEELNRYRAARTLVVVHFRGTRGKEDATAYRIDPSILGQLVDIKEADQRVELTIQDEAGKSWMLLLEQEPGKEEFSLEHLREHMHQQVPLVAFYRERGDTLVAYLLIDAP